MRVEVNGCRMFFDVDGPSLVPSGPEMTERPTVLLLHGGPGIDHSQFKPQYDPLRAFAQVVYVDHSGQGRSDATGPERWTLEAWADDIIEFCDVLEIERPVILGWSFGGMVAMNLAGRYPDRLTKLVLQSTAARLDMELIVAAMEKRGGSEAGQVAHEFWTTATQESMERYMDVCLPLYSPQPIDAESMGRIIMNEELLTGGWAESTTFDLTGLLERIEVPTLVLNGELDPITPPGASEEIIEHLPTHLTTHRSFKASGHFIHETEPAEFFEAIRSFVLEPA